jgi:hypothetical protein
MNKASGSILAVLALAMLTGCGSSSTAPASSSPTGQVSPAGTAPSVTTAKAAAPPSAPSTTNQAQASGAVTINAAGAVLPNSARTPGALNAAVTQANIATTICVPGWTATIRPPSSFTTDLKVQQLASGYAYKGDRATLDYEEDHLISLEIGGAPSNPANLWPEPYNSPEGARVKDVVERKLNTLVCSHAITLATAQRAIATNWWTAYQTYVGPSPTH